MTDTIEQIIRRIIREELAAFAGSLQPRVQVVPAPTETRAWLSTLEVAERSGRHLQTVRLALEAGELHGTQATKGGRWSVRPDCVDAWMERRPCPHENPTTAHKRK